MYDIPQVRIRTFNEETIIYIYDDNLSSRFNTRAYGGILSHEGSLKHWREREFYTQLAIKKNELRYG